MPFLVVLVADRQVEQVGPGFAPARFQGREMSNFGRLVNRFFRGEEGVTSIEYALMGALIAVVCVVAVTNTGKNASLLWTIVCNGVSSAIVGVPAC